MRSFRVVMALCLGLGSMAIVLLLAGCESRPAAEPLKPLIRADEHDPAVWGERYPEVYAQWLATRDKRPAGKSAYKRGYDAGVTYDKLSEFPFMALLFKGWGFGIEYNEPRGHYYMLIDQQQIDHSRVKAGGACLTCKSPYAQDLQVRDKARLFSADYEKAVGMIPQNHQQLGVSCIDCHDTATLKLATRRWTVDAALREIGLAAQDMKASDRRIMVCGQCHCTYSVMKDEGKSVDVDFPWEGARWGAISVEAVIRNLEEQKPRLEWTQQTTGMKLGFIRHPDVEFYTAGSAHFNAGVACNDCHMPPVGPRGATVADHNIMSPLKRDMEPCKQCHVRTPEEMRAKVLAIQQRTLAELIDTGYRVATVAKLFEIANRSLETTSGDSAYDEAARHYRQAFYRLDYMGAENSVGFHNPDEGVRIFADAKREAAEAEAGIRQLLKAKSVSVPAQVDLQFAGYLNGRGERKLRFNRAQYLADPTGSAEKRVPSLTNLLK
jgi:nitrite reductase (cytochrome c-552)